MQHENVIRTSRSKYPNLLGACAFLALALSGPARLQASDHIDSPTIAQDRGADIADLWAFLDPNDNSQVILVLSTQGFIVSGEHFGMVIFDSNIRYRFEIENTGDARPDLFVDVTYSPGLGRLTNQTATIKLTDLNKQVILGFTGPTTIATQVPRPVPPPNPVVTTDPNTGAKFFGGASDDPFFLDDTGANNLVASSLMNPGHPDFFLLGFRRGRDTYAGFNTMATVVSIPASFLRGANTSVIGINAVTQRRTNQKIEDGAYTGQGGFVNVDRQGNPLVNNVLIPAPRKNEYNGATTQADARGVFRGDLIVDLQNFGTDPAHVTQILNMVQVKGDILRLDLNVPNSGPQGGTNPGGGFGNLGGRRLVDDVVDATFTLIHNDVPTTDYVDANEVRFRNVFPFVHDPTQPFPPGHEPDDHTRQ
ncbi:MAG: DUF4331 family protein [Chthoniobacterales bacterium]|nr:DUF4331 family protein [Chthoniobacterales bacterium]